MLDIDKIRQLVEMMVKNDLVEISLRDGEEEVNLRRPNKVTDVAVSEGLLPSGSSNPGVDRGAPLGAAEAGGAPTGTDETELIEIKSPMVGTFYGAPDPDSPPFVSLGLQIHSGMVVCILEAMKVFNEIKAEVAGTIEQILVKNAQAVEFGQPLFLIRPQ